MAGPILALDLQSSSIQNKGMDSDTPSQSLFASLADLTGYTRTLAIARPEDIVREEDGPRVVRALHRTFFGVPS